MTSKSILKKEVYMKETKNSNPTNVIAVKSPIINKNVVVARPNSLRPMKSLVKIKSLRPNSVAQTALKSEAKFD